MSTRELHAYAEWTLSADTRVGVPVAIFLMQFTTCHESAAQTSDDGTPQQTWALYHTGRNPGQQGFKQRGVAGSEEYAAGSRWTWCPTTRRNGPVRPAP